MVTNPDLNTCIIYAGVVLVVMECDIMRVPEKASWITAGVLKCIA